MSAAEHRTPAGGVSTIYSYLEEIRLPAGGTFALIRLTGQGRKPATFSLESLSELEATLEEVRERAAAGEYAGIGITGQDRCFVAGADLTAMKSVTDAEAAHTLARLGHAPTLDERDAVAAIERGSPAGSSSLSRLR